MANGTHNVYRFDTSGKEDLYLESNWNYFVLEKYECGIELKGYEVKSIVKANANIDQAYVIFRNDEAYLINMYVAPYNEAGK